MRLTAIIFSIIGIVCQAQAGELLEIETSLSANTGHGSFAPYFITSNNFGVTTERNSLNLRAGIFRRPDTTRRFDISYGLDLIGSASSTTAYNRYSANTAEWVNYKAPHKWGWIQQLYASLRYRSIFVTAGWQEVGSALLDDRLSSGDLTWSANARPMPGIRFGFNRFVDIPFTAGALQIQCEIFYGRPTDNTWLRQHFNYWTSFITTGRLDSYRRIYFRTNPGKPLYVTFGMQAASQYCGYYTQYEKGEIILVQNQRFKFKDLIGMTIPQPDNAYYAGNHLGSWDIRADWKIGPDKRHTISAYVQWPWEDGSGIGKQNGWDGLWGIQYSSNSTPWLSSVVIEYLDFTNQSGPTHWDADDFPGSTLIDHATGADSYYNNYYYNGYAHYGLAQGTPFLRSPMYNTDGYLHFTDTRVRGFHIGANGVISRTNVSWRMLFSWRKSLGDSYIPRVNKAYDTSWLAEATWKTTKLHGMSVGAQLAMDRGTLYGNTFGAMLTIKWDGSISLPKK